LVDVVARPVGEDGVHQMGLDLRGHRSSRAKPRASLPGVSSSKSQPTRWRSVHIGVHEQRKDATGLPSPPTCWIPYSGFDPADLGDRHENDPSPDLTPDRGLARDPIFSVPMTCGAGLQVLPGTHPFDRSASTRLLESANSGRT